MTRTFIVQVLVEVITIVVIGLFLSFSLNRLFNVDAMVARIVAVSIAVIVTRLLFNRVLKRWRT